MGSWSESCGLSGLEIAEGEPAYVMVIVGPTFGESHGPHDLFRPSSTLIRGTYNDYGDLKIDDDPDLIDLFNQQTGLCLSQHAEFSRDMLDEQSGSKLGDNRYRFWVHGTIFDRLVEIKQEFPYVRSKNGSILVSNLGEAIDLTEKHDREHYLEVARNIKEIMARKGSDPKHDFIEIALLMMRSDSTSSRGRLNSQYHEMIHDLTKSGQSLDAVFLAKRRNTLLTNAAAELRKKIVPSEGVGPQHSGSQASIQFANFILEAQVLRADEEDMD